MVDHTTKKYTQQDLGNTRTFPTPLYGFPGITYRQWLSGHAMQGLLAGPGHHYCDWEWLAGSASAITDAMLALEVREAVSPVC